MLGVVNGLNISSIFDAKLHERPGIQSQALGFSRASSNTDAIFSQEVERGGKRQSTSFNIRDNERNVEQMLKQSLNAFKLIQHRLNFDSTSFNPVSTLLFNKIERMLKQMLKPFDRALRMVPPLATAHTFYASRESPRNYFFWTVSPKSRVCLRCFWLCGKK